MKRLKGREIQTQFVKRKISEQNISHKIKISLDNFA